VHPGTIHVAVLPPVDTSTWTKQTIDEHVQEVRDMFLATLADWPHEQRPTAPEHASP
jgi:putative phosphoserine phosphatase/1-acylglycerol-3-phosphate O-acyltransferase